MSVGIYNVSDEVGTQSTEHYIINILVLKVTWPDTDIITINHGLVNLLDDITISRFIVIDVSGKSSKDQGGIGKMEAKEIVRPSSIDSI